MPLPVINYDAALQYDTGLLPSVEAIARGRQDYINDAMTNARVKSKNPYRDDELRAHWVRGYITEQTDLRTIQTAR